MKLFYKPLLLGSAGLCPAVPGLAGRRTARQSKGFTIKPVCPSCDFFNAMGAA